MREVWRFRTAYSRKIVLHYAPELGHEVVPELLLLHWTNELKRLCLLYTSPSPRDS